MWKNYTIFQKPSRTVVLKALNCWTLQRILVWTEISTEYRSCSIQMAVTVQNQFVRSIEKLQKCDLEIQYQARTSHHKAHGISRRPCLNHGFHCSRLAEYTTTVVSEDSLLEELLKNQENYHDWKRLQRDRRKFTVSIE